MGAPEPARVERRTELELEPAGDASKRLPVRKLLPLAVIVALAAILWVSGLHHYVTLETLVHHRALIDGFITAHYAAAIAAYVALYIAFVALSVPCAAFLSIAGGFLFGTVAGGLAILVSATAGATILFLVARGAGEYITQCGSARLQKIASGFCAHAFNYLLFLRLVPIFPFFLVNLAAALVGVRPLTFVLATALGMIPATFIFASIGAGLDSVIAAQGAAYQICLASGRADCRLDFDPGTALTPQLLGALAGLGLLALVPVVAKRFYLRKLDARVAGCGGTEWPS
jgi:uncharacterized membrane protein YdjX (TVP38/TMEM64 family)